MLRPSRADRRPRFVNTGGGSCGHPADDVTQAKLSVLPRPIGNTIFALDNLHLADGW